MGLSYVPQAYSPLLLRPSHGRGDDTDLFPIQQQLRVGNGAIIRVPPQPHQAFLDLCVGVEAGNNLLAHFNLNFEPQSSGDPEGGLDGGSLTGCFNVNIDSSLSQVD